MCVWVFTPSPEWYSFRTSYPASPLQGTHTATIKSKSKARNSTKGQAAFSSSYDKKGPVVILNQIPMPYTACLYDIQVLAKKKVSIEIKYYCT